MVMGYQWDALVTSLDAQNLLCLKPSIGNAKLVPSKTNPVQANQLAKTLDLSVGCFETSRTTGLTHGKWLLSGWIWDQRVLSRRLLMMLDTIGVFQSRNQTSPKLINLDGWSGLMKMGTGTGQRSFGEMKLQLSWASTQPRDWSPTFQVKSSNPSALTRLITLADKASCFGLLSHTMASPPSLNFTGMRSIISQVEKPRKALSPTRNMQSR
jgi:hypothetical protein